MRCPHCGWENPPENHHCGIIGNILQGGVEIAVHIPFVDGFIGVFRIVDHFLQPAFHRPVSRCRHIIPLSFPFAVR